MKDNTCIKCEYSDRPTYDYPCSSCAGYDDKPMFARKREPIDQAKERLFKSLDDIQKIIDDAMEKGDRSVHISVVGDGVSLNVYPYKEEGRGVWSAIVDDDGWTRSHRCSKCGFEARFETPYCPHCGNEMRRPEPEGEKDE